MDIPVLNLGLPPLKRWVDILLRNPQLEDDWRAMLADFESEAADIINSTIKTKRGRGALWLHGLTSPASASFKEELRGLAYYLGVDWEVLLAGQLVYDAATSGGIDAVCGCTSAAQLYRGRPWHGRLLDWSWPESVRDRVRLIRVVGRGIDYIAEHIPGATGFVGAYTGGVAANLNQAPNSRLRWSAMPALWWFRDAFEKGRFSRPGQAPLGGMTDALIHVTHGSSASTSRFYYRDGTPIPRREKLGSTPVVLANSFGVLQVEDAEDYEWSKWREDAVVGSRRRSPARRLAEAECNDTIHRWAVSL